MKFEFVFAFVFVVLILAILLGIFMNSTISERYIIERIKQSNYCRQDSNCVNIGSKCPFGCDITVHKNEADKIRDLLGSYNSNCMYTCIEISGIRCFNNRCEAVVK